MSADELHFLEIAELSRLLAARKVSPVELAEAMLRRIERVDPALKSYALVTPGACAGAGARGRADDRPAPDPLAAARRADRGEGPVLHRRASPPPRACRCTATSCPTVDATVVRKLREAGAVLLGKLQLTEGAFADHHPDDRAAGQSLAPRPLVGRVVERLGRRDRGRPVLRLARLRHRRLDPLSVGGQRHHRPEADLGPRLALRLLRARRVARPHRADVPQRDRCSDRARRDRRQRSRRPDRAARRRARLPRRRRRATCAACASASTSTTRSAASSPTCAARSKRRSRTVRALGAEIVLDDVPRRRRDDRRLGSALRGRDRGRARDDLPVASAPNTARAWPALHRRRARAVGARLPAHPAAPARLRRPRASRRSRRSTRC